MQSFIAVMTQELNFKFCLVLLVPLTFLLEGNIANRTPSIRPLVFFIGRSRKPLLSRIRGKMVAYISRESSSVVTALHSLWLTRCILVARNKSDGRIDYINKTVSPGTAIRSLRPE